MARMCYYILNESKQHKEEKTCLNYIRIIVLRKNHHLIEMDGNILRSSRNGDIAKTNRFILLRYVRKKNSKKYLFDILSEDLILECI